MEVKRDKKLFMQKNIIFDKHDIEVFEHLGIRLELSENGYKHEIETEDGSLIEIRSYNFRLRYEEEPDKLTLHDILFTISALVIVGIFINGFYHLLHYLGGLIF
jgi:hypothetical protein